jgi:hypothetical protein
MYNFIKILENLGTFRNALKESTVRRNLFQTFFNLKFLLDVWERVNFRLKICFIFMTIFLLLITSLMHELFVIILFLYYDVSLASKRRAFHFKSDKKRVSTILWSDGLVLAFVSVDV